VLWNADQAVTNVASASSAVASSSTRRLISLRPDPAAGASVDIATSLRLRPRAGNPIIVADDLPFRTATRRVARQADVTAEWEGDRMTGTTSTETREPSAWAVGGTALGASLLIMVGLFQGFEGLAAIVNDDFFLRTESYAFALDLTTWGWIHLAFGIVLVLTGFFLLTGSPVASGIAIGLAGLSALSNFLFLPYYPVWAVLVIALDVFVIWAILRTTADR
jgi:hypothetical protein